MKRSTVIVWIVAVLLVVPSLGAAQIGGMQLPSSLSLPSKDTLLKQAQELLADLLGMKGSGKLAPTQAKQVDDLIPKAQSLNDELQKPQVETARLPQLASNLSDLQKQVGVLKGFLK